MRTVGFAVFFIVTILGAVLLIISQIPQKEEYYDVIDTRSFSIGQPLTFYWTFEANARYRFEVKGADWTAQKTFHYMSFGNVTWSYGMQNGLFDPPWVWDWNPEPSTRATNVTFWHYENRAQVIERATASTFVEISQFKETTYKLTYLLYVGLPLLIIGAVLTTITGKNVDSRSQSLSRATGPLRLKPKWV